MKGMIMMNNLLKAIFEAESDGEIDINTRDIMVNILTESKDSDKAKKQKLQDEMRKIIAKREQLNQNRAGLLNKVANKQSYIAKEDIKFSGQKINKGSIINQTRIPKDEFAKYKKQIDKLTKEIKKYDDDKKKLGKQIAKLTESTSIAELIQDVIFEKESNGEVTMDERNALLAYLESKILED